MQDQEIKKLLKKPKGICEKISVVDQKIENIHRVIKVYGKNVTTFHWENSGTYKISFKELISTLNMMKSLKQLNLSMWIEIDDFRDVAELKLKHLSSLELEFCSKEFVELFMLKILPKNTLETLKLKHLRSFGDFKEIFVSQNSIKNLILTGVYFGFEDALKSLKLEKFINITDDFDKQLPNVRKFLHSIFASQLDLKHVELADKFSSNNQVIDDEVFEKISQLSSLETLSLSLDGITQIGGLQNLKNLKDLQLRLSIRKSLDVFRQFTEIKLNSLEELTLSINYDLPSEIYITFAENFPNLKALRISCLTHHKINMFVKFFKNLESLEIKFGENYAKANAVVVDFNEIFEADTGIFHYNLKKIDFNFEETKKINFNDFLEMLEMFPNLESLKVKSKFSFNAELLRKLTKNLKKIETLILESFKIKTVGDLCQENLKALSELTEKLKFVDLTFKNSEETETGDCEPFFPPFFKTLEEVISGSIISIRHENSYCNFNHTMKIIARR